MATGRTGTVSVDTHWQCVSCEFETKADDEARMHAIIAGHSIVGKEIPYVGGE